MLNFDRPVSEGMTPMPLTVSAGESVAEAAGRMRALGVHQLPVQDDDGTVIGLLLDRDVEYVYLTGGRDASQTTVEDVMMLDPYMVTAETPLRTVFRTMAESHTPACIVVEDERPVGIVTATDALHMLADLLTSRADVSFPDHDLDEARAQIRSDHQRLRQSCAELERIAVAILSGENDEDEERFRNRCRELCRMLAGHIDLEDGLLTTITRQSSDVRATLVSELVEEHARQRRGLAFALDVVEHRSGRALARATRRLIAGLDAEMEREERLLFDDEPSPARPESE